MRVPSIAILLALALLPVRDAAAVRPLADYRYFRALSIDLLGRPPTRDEIAAFERPDFRFDQWIDQHLKGPSYAARVRRIYMDLLRLELGPAVQFGPSSVVLRRARIAGADGRTIEVHYRIGQRRANPQIDGDLCFAPAEVGLQGARGGPIGTVAVSQALLDARTVEVRPWWLYADYRAKQPRDLASSDWIRRFPGMELVLSRFVDPGGRPTTTIRVCREEAQLALRGRVFLTGRASVPRVPLASGRKRPAPADSALARANRGGTVSCLTQTGFQNSAECGCGIGLERCFPDGPNGFVLPHLAPLGSDAPFTTAVRSAGLWLKQWWNEEPRRFMDRIFAEDRDVRELLTSRATVINGPLAQFYRGMASSTCCGTGADLGYVDPEPLFDPRKVPPALQPQDAANWTVVPDRGPHAAGLLTMPAFLLKYGTRRARAHVVYQAFLCRDFVASQVAVKPSDEVDLMRRPGCARCHRTLDPMAAYFTRIEENDWTYLPARYFPLSHPRCTAADPARMPGVCRPFYDPAFTDARQTFLRGAHGATSNVDAGPAGLASEIVGTDAFATCVARNIASSFLGRSLGPGDAAFEGQLTRTFRDGGYRMRALVRAVVTSPQYRIADAKGAP